MNNRSMLGLGLVSSLVCGTAASGQFVFQGIDYRIAETNAVAGDFNWTVEFYVVLNSDERLDAVAGDGVNDKRLATSGTFYQNPFGGPTSMEINPLLYGNFPSLQYDSFVTIGAMDNTGYPYTNNALMNIGIDWTNFEDNGGDVYTNNGLWFVTPDDAQGQPMLFTNHNCVDKYGVLIARVTVFDPLQNANVFIGALFQGKDNTGTTWQATGSIEAFNLTITDCNNNGVDDTCDISNGTSFDDNGNGIPDECEFPDCNGNGIDDSVDIANGTSADCDLDGTPDECQMADGDCNGNGILDACETFDDCNGNGIPDECETLNDCNGNGIPDECEALTDWDGNGVPDICEGLVAYNATQSVGYGHVDDAVAGANASDVVWVQAEHVNLLTDLDYRGRGIDVSVMGGDAAGFSVQLANASELHGGVNAALNSIRSGTSGTASVAASSTLAGNSATIYRSSSLDINAPSASLGNVTMRMDSELGFSNGGSATGAWTCATGSTIYGDIAVAGSLTGTVNIYGSATNGGEVRATDDILISSDLTNNNLVAIHRGVLYVLGNLTNNGTILGQVDQGPAARGGGTPPSAGDGLRVVGNYAAGNAASLFMQHVNWRLAVGGNFDVAIDDNARFDMSLAALDFTSHTGQDPQLVEVMSADSGGIEDALSPLYPGAFPVGTIRVNAGATVDLVDNHDNDLAGQALSEVIYTPNLVVEAGGTLRTNGYIIYASTVDNQGTIDGEGDIIIINPPIPGDLDGDGTVAILDLLILIGDWGACTNCASDLNSDGAVDVLDLLVVIANWS